jgi:hypothetical protein
MEKFQNIKLQLDQVRQRGDPKLQLDTSAKYIVLKDTVERMRVEAQDQSETVRKARVDFNEAVAERDRALAADTADRINKTVKKGMTLGQVEQMWGEANSVSDFGDGKETRQWEEKSTHVVHLQLSNGRIINESQPFISRILTVTFIDGSVVSVLDTKYNIDDN